MLPLLLLLAGCAEDMDGSLIHFVAGFEAHEARPGFTAARTVVLRNDSGSVYELTALAIEADDPDARPGLFRAELADPDLAFPIRIEPLDGVEVRVFFSPATLGEETATLQAVTYLTDFRVGGGGCSTGEGRAAPEDTLRTVWGGVAAAGTADAPFEDCTDGVDNDADGTIDCEDVDCRGDGECVPTKGCSPTGDLGCDTAVTSSTRGRENTFEQYCGIAADAFTAPEEVWSWIPAETGPATVRLEAAGWNADLFLLEGTFEPDGTLRCDAEACVARSTSDGPSERIDFTGEAGRGYFFVVDGEAGEGGDYSLSVGCGFDEETDCSDGLDDDGDGLVDCDDADCALAPECLPSGTCEPGGTLSCGDEITGINAGGGTTRDIDRWCGDPAAGHDGTEVAWRFVSDETTNVTLTLSELAGDLDVIGMLENPAGGGTCDPSLCIFDEEWVRGTGDETIRFDAFQGSPYVIAVDGWDGATSSFRLSITCE